MRSSDVQEYRPIRMLLRRLVNAPTAFAILWPTLLIVGGYVGWHRWGSEHVSANYYNVDPTRIEVTAPPEYVRSNIVQAVYRDTAMDGLSLLDRQATAKIASAFSMHPWVRKVIGVRKLPGGVIDVRLEYRVPVAMVLVFNPDPKDKRPYFSPIDGDGILLPDKEFARSETRDFIQVEIPNIFFSSASVGSPFGDSRVKHAAKLAEVLAPYREQAAIRSIGIHGDPRSWAVPQFEVIRLDGTKFTWGSPPGSELPGEGTATMKIQALIARATDAGTDLRMASPGRQTH